MALQSALVAVIVGERMEISAADVAEAIHGIFDMPMEVFSVHVHRPANLLIYFTALEDRRMVLDQHFIQSPYFRLLVKPWSRRAHATAGSLGVLVSLEVEGVPANAWSLATADTMPAPNSWVDSNNNHGPNCGVKQMQSFTEFVKNRGECFEILTC